MDKKEFKQLTMEEQERIRTIISNRFNECLNDIEDATGYYTDGYWSILADDVNKSINVDLYISMLNRPHAINERKVKHYLKVNPHNVLDEPIYAFKWNNWYEIYNGVHRTEAHRKLGDKTIKAIIIEPDEETLKDRNLIK